VNTFYTNIGYDHFIRLKLMDEEDNKKNCIFAISTALARLISLK